MWNYNQTPELMHYGIMGMKWGQRRANSLASAVKKQREKRAKIRETKGAPSAAYRTASKNLYITKSKSDLAKARVNHDPSGAVIAKSNLREGRNFKRHGTAGFYTSYTRKVYGHNLSKEEELAISIKENRIGSGKAAVATAISTIGTVATIAMMTPKGRAVIEKGLNTAVSAGQKGLNIAISSGEKIIGKIFRK